ASAPQGSQARMKHVDVVSLEPTEVLLILLLDGNLLRQQVLHVSQPATQVALTRLTAMLNQSLAGRLSEEVRRHYQNSELGLEKEVVGSIVVALDQYEKGAENLVVHDGVRNLVRQPEFAESSRLQQVLEVLEETRYLTVLLRELIGESDLQIVIGSENTSDSRNSRTSSSKVVLAYHPSSFIAVDASPRSSCTSAGRMYASSTITYFCQSRLTIANAAATKSRTERISPVAIT